MSDEPLDPLATIDAARQFAEHLRGMVQVLIDDGWTDEHARLLVLQCVLSQSRT